MARTALLHLVRSQSRTFFRSGDHITKAVPWSHASSTKIDARPTTRFASSHIRWASQAALAKDDTEISTRPRQVKEDKKEDKDKEIVYYGPQASILKKVKYLSLTSCLAAATVGPIITSVSSLAMAGKVSTTATIILFSIGTTVGLHWFVGPYIHKLRWQPGSDSFEIEMMSFLNMPVKRTIKFEDIRPAETLRPSVSFMANGDRITKVVPWSHASSTKIDASPTTRFASSHIRWASQAALAEDDTKISIGPRNVKGNKKEDEDKDIVYYGPIASTLKKVKILSLSTCCLSATFGPALTFMASPDMSMILKGVVASSIVLFSISTTVVLHWFVSPYVHKLRWQPGSDSFEVEMMSWLTTYVKKTIKFEDIRVPQTKRPYVSFMANGSFYFIDPGHCRNKALLEKLTPKKL